jgi:hypothetical protein
MKKHYFNLFISVLFLFFISCSSDDNNEPIPEQFLNANVNGVEFKSDSNIMPLGFSRILVSGGRINLHVKAISADGNVLEFMVDNFQGTGKHYFGDSFYDKSWVKFDMPTKAESWSVNSSETLDHHTNFIEITSIKDNYIVGKIVCDELINHDNGFLGRMQGEFRLIIIEK